MDPLFTVWLSAVYHNAIGWRKLPLIQFRTTEHGSLFEQYEAWTETLSSTSGQAELAAQLYFETLHFSGYVRDVLHMQIWSQLEEYYNRYSPLTRTAYVDQIQEQIGNTAWKGQWLCMIPCARTACSSYDPYSWKWAVVKISCRHEAAIFNPSFYEKTL